MINTSHRRHRGEPALPPQPQLRSALCRVHADLLLAVVSKQTDSGARTDSFASSGSALTPDTAAIVENVRWAGSLLSACMFACDRSCLAVCRV